MSKLKVKMELEFWYDPETNSYEPISQKVIEDEPKSVSTVKPSKKKKVDNSSEPEVILEENKLVLNDKALEVLGISPDDRVTIGYKKIDGKMVPTIASDEVLGTKSGNKLTKSGTVACRGKANEKLSAYGSNFKLVRIEETSVCIMVGDKEPTPYKEVDKNIQVTEPEDSHDLSDLQSVGLDMDLDAVDEAVEISFDDIL